MRRPSFSVLRACAAATEVPEPLGSIALRDPDQPAFAWVKTDDDILSAVILETTDRGLCVGGGAMTRREWSASRLPYWSGVQGMPLFLEDFSRGGEVFTVRLDRDDAWAPLFPDPALTGPELDPGQVLAPATEDELAWLNETIDDTVPDAYLFTKRNAGSTAWTDRFVAALQCAEKTSSELRDALVKTRREHD